MELGEDPLWRVVFRVGDEMGVDRGELIEVGGEIFVFFGYARREVEF